MAAPSAQSITKDRIDFEREMDESPIIGLLSADKILDTDWPEPNWVVNDYLPSGLTILAGKPKAGKSWLALQIAQAVGVGGMALGKKVVKGPVLYLALEDPARRIKDRMLKQQWLHGSEVEFMPLGQFQDTIGDLKNGGGIRLAEQIEYGKYRLAVIDTLSRAIQGDQNEVDEMTANLTPLQEIAHRTNCAILLIDHHKKSVMDQDAIGDILGSTAKGAMADCAWGLYREKGKPAASLSIIGRDVVEVTLKLTMDWELGCWQSEGEEGDLERAEQVNDLIAYIESVGGSGLIQISEAVERNKGTVLRQLNDLIAEGILARKGEGRGKVKYEIAPKF